jgi:hypothetical protein
MAMSLFAGILALGQLRHAGAHRRRGLPAHTVGSVMSSLTKGTTMSTKSGRSGF